MTMPWIPTSAPPIRGQKWNLAVVLDGVSGIKVWMGADYAMKPVKYWNGSGWVEKPVKDFTGAAWLARTE